MVERIIFRTLLRHLTVFPVAGLIGPRHAGKTTLARNIVKWLGKPSIYLDLEFGSEIHKLDDPEAFLEEYSNHCVVIDEIQRRPDLFDTIHKLISVHENPGRFLIISSAVSESLRQKAGLLAGSVIYHILYPLDRLEIIDEYELEIHWLRGGLPESLMTAEDMESFRWRDNLIRTYCERDLPQAGLKADTQMILRFLTMLATGQGDIWNASDFARSLGLTSPTINKYLDYMEDAFLVSKLRPYQLNISKRLVKAPKVYIDDTGILHTLLRIETAEELRNHIIAGNSWEGYVISQIKSLLGRKAEIYFYQSHQGARADIVIVRDARPEISIEIQTIDKPQISKGFKIAIKDLNSRTNYIVTPSSATYRVAFNIQVTSLDDLLKQLMKVYATRDL